MARKPGRPPSKPTCTPISRESKALATKKIAECYPRRATASQVEAEVDAGAADNEPLNPTPTGQQAQALTPTPTDADQQAQVPRQTLTTEPPGEPRETPVDATPGVDTSPTQTETPVEHVEVTPMAPVDVIRPDPETPVEQGETSVAPLELSLIHI